MVNKCIRDTPGNVNAMDNFDLVINLCIWILSSWIRIKSCIPLKWVEFMGICLKLSSPLFALWMQGKYAYLTVFRGVFFYLIFRKNLCTISFLRFAKGIAKFKHVKAVTFYDYTGQSALRNFLCLSGANLSWQVFFFCPSHTVVLRGRKRRLAVFL